MMESATPFTECQTDLIIQIKTITNEWSFQVKREVMNQVFKMIVPEDYKGSIDFGDMTLLRGEEGKKLVREAARPPIISIIDKS